jgi:fructokinase
MKQMGLCTRHVRQITGYPTGTASVVLDASGQPRFSINHPAAYDFSLLSEQEANQLCSLPPDLIYFGTLCQMSASARQATLTLLEGCSAPHHFYDVNLRADSYEPGLVRELMSRATVVKVNDDEVRAIAEMLGRPIHSLEHFCRSYAEKFRWEAVCVTRGAQGCVLLMKDLFGVYAGYRVMVADTIGAGDAFAAALAHGLVSGWEAPKTADFANRVGALVASHAGATPAWTREEAARLRH